MDEGLTFGGGRRQGSFSDKKMAVLREAAKAFVDNGVTQTSLDDIADRLGVTKPAVYYYVKSKDEIISECLALAHKDDEASLARIGAQNISGLEKVRELMLYYGHKIQDDFGKCLVLVDRHALADHSMEKFRDSQRYLFEGSRSFVVEGIQDGSIRECDPTVVTFALVGALNSMAYWFNTKGARSTEAVIVEISQLVEAGLAPRKG